MPNKPTTVPNLDTNSTNRVIPAPSKVTDGFALNDILPAANVNYLWGWTGDWLDWLDATFGDGPSAGDLLVNGNLGVGSGVTSRHNLTAGGQLGFDGQEGHLLGWNIYYGSGVFKYISNDYGFMLRGGANGNMSIWTAPLNASGPDATASSLTEKFRFTTDAKFAIGGSFAPEARLHVAGHNYDGGIFVEDDSSSHASPVVRVLGKRSDENVNPLFSGRIVLERLHTASKILVNQLLGSVVFGGNHTDGTEANIAYPAMIGARAEGSFDDVNTMPTGLAFYTGSTGIADLNLSGYYGSERMRIDSSGKVGIGTTPTRKFDVLGEAGGAEGTPTYGGSDVAVFRNNQVATTGCYVDIVAGSTGYAGINFGDYTDRDKAAILGDNNNVRLYLSVGGNIRQTVRGDGRVSFADGYVAPGSRVHVYEGASGQTPQTGTILTLEDNADCFLSFLTPAANSAGIWFARVSDRDNGRIVYDHSGDELQLWAGATQLVTINTTDGLYGTSKVKAPLYECSTSKTIPVSFLDAQPDGEGWTSIFRTNSYIAFYDSATSRMYKHQPAPLAGTVTAVSIRLKGTATHKFKVTLWKRDYSLGYTGTALAVAEADYSPAPGFDISAAAGVVVTMFVFNATIGENDSLHWVIQNMETADALIVLPASITLTPTNVTLTK